MKTRIAVIVCILSLLFAAGAVADEFITIGKLHGFLVDTLGEILAADPRSQHDVDYFLARKFPRDVEEVLFEVPQVKEAAVVAIAGQPIAFVIAQKDRPTAQALIAYCKRRLPPELVPRLVIFVDDFPRTFIGKVLRRELAKLFEESKPKGG